MEMSIEQTNNTQKTPPSSSLSTPPSFFLDPQHHPHHPHSLLRRLQPSTTKTQSNGAISITPYSLALSNPNQTPIPTSALDSVPVESSYGPAHNHPARILAQFYSPPPAVHDEPQEGRRDYQITRASTTDHSTRTMGSESEEKTKPDAVVLHLPGAIILPSPPPRSASSALSFSFCHNSPGSTPPTSSGHYSPRDATPARSPKTEVDDGQGPLLLLPSDSHPETGGGASPRLRPPPPVTPFTPSFSDLPAEILIEIFDWLPSLQQSQDRLNVCSVCKRWSGPAQTVLWRELWLGTCSSVLGLNNALCSNPSLGRLPRRLRFSTQDENYLVNLDADAVFNAMAMMAQLESFEVLVPYAGGELYDSLCEELSGSPIKQVILAAHEGIGRCHVEASMRFEGLEYLELIKLGKLADLQSLEVEWTFPNTLFELVLVQPELDGEDFRFLLSHTKHTLRKLRIDFGPPPPEDVRQLEEEALQQGLLESGSELQLLELKWQNCVQPILDQIIRSCWCLEELITFGPVCTPGVIEAKSCHRLKRFEYQIPPNSLPGQELMDLSRSDDQTKYHIRSYRLRTARPPVTEWEEQEDSMSKILTTHREQREIDERESRKLNQIAWDNLEALDIWRSIGDRMKDRGIEFEVDFI